MAGKNINLKILIAVALLSTVSLAVVFGLNYYNALAEIKNTDQQQVITSEPKADTEQAVLDEQLAAIDFNVETEDQVVDNAGSDVELASAQVDAAGKSVVKKQVNTLKVAAMNVDTTILEGPTVKTLDRGIWRLPGTSTPDKGGNTVIAAHRWKWLPASKKSFYDIHKVVVGDEISIGWAGKTYTYKVNKISTVKPDQVEILTNTKEAKLTLFSCTPLFSSKYRLVVEANLININ